MIVDSSAVIAILKKEPEAERFARAIAASPVRRISAGNLLEVGIVAGNRTAPRMGHQLDLLIRRATITSSR